MIIKYTSLVIYIYFYNTFHIGISRKSLYIATNIPNTYENNIDITMTGLRAKINQSDAQNVTAINMFG